MLRDAINFAFARNQRNVQIRNWFVGALSVVGVGILIFTGFGFLTTVGLAIIVFLIVVFGSVGKLVSSFIIASLTTMFLPNIKEFVLIFFSGVRTEKLFTMIDSTGWWKLTLMIFLFTYTLSYITGCFQFLKIAASTKVENKSGD